MDCGICLEEMKTSSFIVPDPDIGKEDEVDKQDATCIRLKCGHAFHASCICTSFRAGMACPVCRDSVTNNQVPNIQGFQLENGAFNFTINGAVVNGTVELDPEEEDNPELDRMDEERTKIRVRNYAVKKARSEFKKNLRNYRQMCESLRSERKKIISNALVEMKNAKREIFMKTSESVRKSLRKVEDIERKSLMRISENPEEVRSYFRAVREFDYDAHELMRCKDPDSADPLQKKFWGL